MKRTLEVVVFLSALAAVLPALAQDLIVTDNIGLLATLQVAGEGNEQVYELAVYEDWAFVAAGVEGIKAVDLRHPRAPVVEGALSDIGTAVYVVVRTLNEIYVLSKDITRPGGATHEQGLFILRWNPYSLLFDERGFAALEDSDGAGETLDLQYPMLYLAAFPKLFPIDVSVPDRPTVGPFWDLPFSANDIVRSDRWSFMFYVAAGAKGLGIYETLHAPPRVLDGPPVLSDTPGYANRVELHNMHCYLSDGYGGLRIIDVSDPNAPFESGAFEPSGYGEIRSLDLTFPVAYLASGFGGLLAVDVSASPPQQLAAIEPVEPNPDYNVRAVAFGAAEDLVIYLTEQGLLSVAQYPKRIPTPTPDVDFNDDGRVDSLDVFLFGRQWQLQYPTPTPTPE